MKLIYRPEIDGLRAIAVGAVIFYHAQIKIFTGGFIGVDVFFVISGYLITSISLKELVTTGHFSFKHFYERRVRRIIPALLTVMLTSLSLAWIYLFPINLIDLSNNKKDISEDTSKNEEVVSVSNSISKSYTSANCKGDLEICAFFKDKLITFTYDEGEVKWSEELKNELIEIVSWFKKVRNLNLF